MRIRCLSKRETFFSNYRCARRWRHRGPHARTSHWGVLLIWERKETLRGKLMKLLEEPKGEA